METPTTHNTEYINPCHDALPYDEVQALMNNGRKVDQEDASLLAESLQSLTRAQAMERAHPTTFDMRVKYRLLQERLAKMPNPFKNKNLKRAVKIKAHERPVREGDK